jgi:hypothetical protein
LAKRRFNQRTTLPPMPLSELQNMKVLMAKAALPPADDLTVPTAAPRTPVLDLRRGSALRCPNDHTVHPIFDVCTLRDSLDRKHVQYFCFGCGRDWVLSPAEQANVRDWLDGLNAPCDTDLMAHIVAILREHWMPGLSDRAYGQFAPLIWPLVEIGNDAAVIALRLESFEGEIIGPPTSAAHRLIVAGKLLDAVRGPGG